MLKTYLPDSITLPCGTVLDQRISIIPGIGLSMRAQITKIRARGGKYRKVEVLSRNLRGKTDLHHRPYQPSVWLLTDKSVVDDGAPKECHSG